MTFAALRLQLRRRFPKLPPADLAAYINFARAELDASELWPYLEVNVADPAPFELADLGTVIAVQDSLGNPLVFADIRWLINEFGDLGLNGPPVYYYVTNPAGVTRVETYPTDSNEITVRYIEISDDLVASTESPLAPPQFHRIILDMAARDAYRDANQPDLAEQQQVLVDRGLERMRKSLLTRSVQGPMQRITITGDNW